MNRIFWAIVAILMLALPVTGQQAYSAYEYSGGGWVAASTTATNGAVSYVPPAAALYCYNSSLKQWVPADSSCFGGGGSSITLTTTGTGGAATLSGGVLNIPIYAAGGNLSGTLTAPYLPVASGTNTLINSYVQGPTILSSPSAPTVTPTGGSATTWSYKIVALTISGATLPSTAGTTTSGAATLDGTHFNTVTWTAVTGATGYDVYRTAGAANVGGRVAANVAGTSFTDNLQANGALDCCVLPSVNSTGNIYSLYGYTTPGGVWFSPPTSSFTWHGFQENSRDAASVVASVGSPPTYSLYIYKEGITGSINPLYTQAVALGGGISTYGIEGDAYYEVGNSSGVYTLAGMVGNAVYDAAATGPVSTYMTSFDAISNVGVAANIPANYGFHAQDQHGVSSTLNAAVGIDDQGTGATDYAIYIAGGKTYSHGAMQLDNITGHGTAGVVHSDTSGNLSQSAVNLATEVGSSILPIANGGNGTSTIPSSFSWSIQAGTTTSTVEQILYAAHTGALTSCFVGITTTDPSTALVFDLKQNGSSILSGGAQTIAATTTGHVAYSLTSGSVAVAQYDQFVPSFTTIGAAWFVQITCH